MGADHVPFHLVDQCASIRDGCVSVGCQRGMANPWMVGRIEYAAAILCRMIGSEPDQDDFAWITLGIGHNNDQVLQPALNDEGIPLLHPSLRNPAIIAPSSASSSTRAASPSRPTAASISDAGIKVLSAFL